MTVCPKCKTEYDNGGNSKMFILNNMPNTPQKPLHGEPIKPESIEDMDQNPLRSMRKFFISDKTKNKSFVDDLKNKDYKRGFLDGIDQVRWFMPGIETHCCKICGRGNKDCMHGDNFFVSGRTSLKQQISDKIEELEKKFL